VSTVLEIPRLPLQEKSVNRPLTLLAERVASHPKLFSQKFYDDLLGITGVMITLTVIFSGVYVFFRYLL
jgi:hypothetical protein